MSEPSRVPSFLCTASTVQVPAWSRAGHRAMRCCAVVVALVCAAQIQAASASAAPPLLWADAADFPLMDAPTTQVDTAVGPVRIGEGVRAEAAAVEALRSIVASARAAGMSASPGAVLTFDRGQLADYRLMAGKGEVLALPEGVAKRVQVDPGSATAAEHLRSAAQRVEGAQLPPLARTALRKQLDEIIASESDDLEKRQVHPELVRAMARARFLDALRSALAATAATATADASAAAQALKAIDEVEAAALAALAPVCIDAWEGPQVTVRQYRAAGAPQSAQWGEWWTLVTPQRAVLLARMPRLEFAPADLFDACRVRVVFPPGCDPLRPTAADLARAQLTLIQRDGRSDIEVCSYAPPAAGSTAPAFRVDRDAWRRLVVKARQGTDVLSDRIPPHIAVVDGEGRARLIATAHGAVPLLPDRSTPADRERLLAAAAQALPDAAHLDLLGVHAFRYVYDSPDPRFPTIPGDKDLHGDIHQTSDQTLATAASGVCRGDCDDLAELYHAILAKQGRNPIVISVPGHAACAFAERDTASARWNAYVLQTGPALGFQASELPQALRAMYGHFDPRSAFDPSEVSLALRFAGENTRTHWRLSWRIFADPSYAKAMIQVQRDWFFRTYLNGVTTMKAMVDSGDDDTANCTELAGLYRITGQWDECLAWFDRALPKLSPTGRLQRESEIISILTGAGRHAEAGVLARRLVERDLPALQKQFGGAVPRVALTIASGLNAAQHGDLQARIAARWLLPAMQAAESRLQTAHQRKDEHAFERAMQELKPLAAGCAALGHGLWAARSASVAEASALAPDADVLALIKCAQRWDDGYGLLFAEDPDDRTRFHAGVAATYIRVLGYEAFQRLRDAAPPATPAPADAANERVGGLAQIILDMPAIRLSPEHWHAEISADIWGRDDNLLAPQRRRGKTSRTALEDPDLVSLRRHRASLDLACDRLREAGQLQPSHEFMQLNAALLAALAEADPVAVRAVLERFAARRDRAVTESAATLLGQCAGRFAPAAWTQVLDAWKTTIDSKPYWLEIAWAAHLNGHAAQARSAAAAAAARFPDDPAFANEARWIDDISARAAAKAAAGSATSGSATSGSATSGSATKSKPQR